MATTNSSPSTEPVLCKRCRIGDYVCGDDSEGDYVAGRISKVSGDLITVTTRLNTTHELLKYETYKSSKASFDAYGNPNSTTAESVPPVEVIDTQAKVDELAPVDLNFDPDFDAPQPMHGNGLDVASAYTSLATEGTSSASENAPGHVSPYLPAPSTKATTPPADGSCPFCGAGAAQQTPNDHNVSNPRSNYCNSCGRAWSMKTGREVKVVEGPVRLYPDLTRYVRHAEHTASGRKVLDVNDQVAEALRGLNLEDTYRQVARYLAALGVKPTAAKPVTMSGLQAKYGHLNPGMQRMCLGNLLRGVTRRTGDNLPEVAFGEDLENPDA